MSDISLNAYEIVQETTKPRHYTAGEIECKDAMAQMMGSSYCIQPEANNGHAQNIPPMGFFWWAAAFKYLWRWTRKGGVQDLMKCQQSITFLIEEVSHASNDS